MKTFNINDPILHFSGKPLTDNQRGGDDKNIYFRDILIEAIVPMFQVQALNQAPGQVLSPDFGKVILAHKVSQKLFDCTIDPIELEDAEFSLLQEAVKGQNTVQRFPVTILGPVYERLQSAEPVAPDLHVVPKD